MRYPALVFVRGSSRLSFIIRAAQRLRFRGADASFAEWSHVAILLDADDVVEALSGVGVVRHGVPADWGTRTVKVVAIVASAEDRAEMRAFVLGQVGKQYGMLTGLSAGLHILTRGRFTLGMDGTDICSGLAAKMLDKGPLDFDDPTRMAPAELAKLFHALPAQTHTPVSGRPSPRGA